MAVLPIPTMLSGFSSLATLIHRVSASRAADTAAIEDLEDIEEDGENTEEEQALQALSAKEFQSILQSLVMGITGETEASNPTTEQLTGVLSPVLFNYFDRDNNGVIEGSEAERLQQILDLLHPEMLQEALDRVRGVETVKEPEGQEDEEGADEIAAPERVERQRIRPQPGLTADERLFRAQATRMIRI